MLIAFLGTVDGWMTLGDEELREHLTEIHGVLPTVSSFAELVKAVTEIGIGTVSLTAAFAWESRSSRVTKRSPRRR